MYIKICKVCFSFKAPFSESFLSQDYPSLVIGDNGYHQQNGVHGGMIMITKMIVAIIIIMMIMVDG